MDLCAWLAGALAAVGAFAVRQTVELARANAMIRQADARLAGELRRARDAALKRARDLEDRSP